MTDLVEEINSRAELDQILETHPEVVVDFSALAWCVPCKRLKPHYDKAAEILTGVKFLYVDADTMNPDFNEVFQFSSVPYVLHFKNGEVRELKGRTVQQLIAEIEKD